MRRVALSSRSHLHALSWSAPPRQQNDPGRAGRASLPEAEKSPGELPGDETIKNSEVAYNMALEFAGQQNMEAAHHYIDLAMKLRPDAKYSYTQGLLFSPRTKFHGRPRQLAAVPGAGPRHPGNNLAVLNAMGVCYKELGQDDEALGEVPEVVNTPGLFSRYESYYNMGVIYLRQKKYLDAEAVFRRSSRRTPATTGPTTSSGSWRPTRATGATPRVYKKAIDIISADYGANQADGAEIYCNYGEALSQQQLYPRGPERPHAGAEDRPRERCTARGPRSSSPARGD